MNKITARCILICAIAAYIAFSVAAPWVLSDSNTFLRDFVDADLLQVLGVIVAITLASAANLHLEFNNIEDGIGHELLSNTRRALKRSTHWLLYLFAIAVIAAVVKPLSPNTEVCRAFVNGLALLILLVNVLILVDLTRLVFRIDPMFKIRPPGSPKP